MARFPESPHRQGSWKEIGKRYVEFKDADAAIAFQKTIVAKGSAGTWGKGVNSCVTHAIDVLRAGCAKEIDNLPKTIDEGFYKSLLNLLDN